MAEYTRRVRNTDDCGVCRSFDKTIGFGACWAEIMKAVCASHSELCASGRVEWGKDAPDDAIIVFFEQDKVSDA
jgi:hypothetical protein